MKKTYMAIDTHVGGENAKIITNGLPFIRANSIAEIRKTLSSNYDYIRKSLMMEPIGHRDMFGAILFPPINTDADVGVVFIDSSSYVNMCGHATLSVAIVAIQLGMVELGKSSTQVVKIETPVGLIKTVVDIENGLVSMINMPSFVYGMNYKLKDFVFDIVFGGDFFIIIDADKINLNINLKNLKIFKKVGMELLKEANKKIKVSHPTEKQITYIDSVEFYSPSERKNIVIYGDYQVDRSPCGVGTAATMALLYEKGKLGVGEEYIQKSIINSQFKGEILEIVKVANYNAIIPKITGRPYIIGSSQIYVDSRDELSSGFLL